MHAEGGGLFYCILLQRDAGFMEVLYSSILGKLDLGWTIQAFLNSCEDRRGCWKIPAPFNLITSCFDLEDNAVGVENHLNMV